MSCCAIAYCTSASRLFRSFCGSSSATVVPSGAASRGKSSAGRVCSWKRLLPLRTWSRLSAALSVTSAPSGNARRMSRSLRAPTVRLFPSAACAAAAALISISMSVATNASRPESPASSTFDSIGRVWRRSMMPATACKGFSRVSRLVFNRFIYLVPETSNEGAARGGQVRRPEADQMLRLWRSCARRCGRAAPAHARRDGASPGTRITHSAVRSYTGDAHRLSLEGLLEHVEVAVEVGVLGAQRGDRPARVQHRGVVAIAERVADLRQAHLGELFGERHRHLARPRDIAVAFLRVQVGDLYLVELRDGALDVLDRDL